jgi:hypothetical protein
MPRTGVLGQATRIDPRPAEFVHVGFHAKTVPSERGYSIALGQQFKILCAERRGLE